VRAGLRVHPLLYHEGVGFTTSLFSSSFFTLTGFYGIYDGRHHHAGMSPVAIARRSSKSGNSAEVVELIGLYWHFVDIVLIVIFTPSIWIPHEVRTMTTTESAILRGARWHDDGHAHKPTSLIGRRVAGDRHRRRGNFALPEYR